MSKGTFKIDKEKLEVTQERIFDAPIERLWRAYTDPEQIPKWWGPAYLKTVVDKMEVRVGGKWRFIQTEPSGKEHAFNGVYKVVDKPTRLSDTFEYEPVPGHILLETFMFEEDGRKTKLTAISKFASIEDLEGMMAMDMQEGATESQERLAKLVEGS